MFNSFRVLAILSAFALTACAGDGEPLPASAQVTPEPLKAEVCLEFSENQFCPVWDRTINGMRHVEYLREGESLDSWTEMVTIRKYDNADELKDVLPGYMHSVRSMLALKPGVFTKKDSQHDDQVLLFLVLKAPDNSMVEVVTNSFYHNNGGVVWSVFHSYRMPFAQQIDFSNVMKQKGNWMDQVSEIEAAALLETRKAESL